MDDLIREARRRMSADHDNTAAPDGWRLVARWAGAYRPANDNRQGWPSPPAAA